MDSRAIKHLHPEVAYLMGLFFRACISEGITLFQTSTYRDHAAQDVMYATGRNQPGRVITNARAGESWHQWGFAFDVAFRPQGNPNGATWEGPWDRVGEIGQRLRLEWGGEWATPDRPHFQHVPGWAEWPEPTDQCVELAERMRAYALDRWRQSIVVPIIETWRV